MIYSYQWQLKLVKPEYQVQVNGEIQTAYEERGRYEELADSKYTGTGAIFDIMAFTVIRQNLYESPAA